MSPSATQDPHRLRSPCPCHLRFPEWGLPCALSSMWAVEMRPPHTHSHLGNPCAACHTRLVTGTPSLDPHGTLGPQEVGRDGVGAEGVSASVLLDGGFAGGAVVALVTSGFHQVQNDPVATLSPAGDAVWGHDSWLLVKRGQEAFRPPWASPSLSCPQDQLGLRTAPDRADAHPVRVLHGWIPGRTPEKRYGGHSPSSRSPTVADRPLKEDLDCAAPQEEGLSET